MLFTLTGEASLHLCENYTCLIVLLKVALFSHLHSILHIVCYQFFARKICYVTLYHASHTFTSIFTLTSVIILSFSPIHA